MNFLFDENILGRFFFCVYKKTADVSTFGKKNYDLTLHNVTPFHRWESVNNIVWKSAGLNKIYFDFTDELSPFIFLFWVIFLKWLSDNSTTQRF